MIVCHGQDTCGWMFTREPSWPRPYDPGESRPLGEENATRVRAPTLTDGALAGRLGMFVCAFGDLAVLVLLGLELGPSHRRVAPLWEFLQQVTLRLQLFKG